MTASRLNSKDRNRATSVADSLLAAIRAERATFEEAARSAEEERTLPSEIVERMRALGLFWLKTPRSLGGSELEPTEFAILLEQLAYYDASAAWAMMVGNGTTGTMAGWLPDEGVAVAFADAERLPIFAGQFVPTGVATPVPGGYDVTGRWSFCSGINHADWVVGSAVVDGGAEIAVAVPKSDATLHDTWYAAGLQGTGSGDFSLTETFVPAAHSFAWGVGPAQRGGHLYRQPALLFVANELSPVAVGITLRAIDDMLEAASRTSRRPRRGSAAPLAERAVFQRELARASAAVRSLQLLYRDAVSSCWEATRSGAGVDDALIARAMAEHVYVVHGCADIVVQLFRYGGGRVLALSNPMQRHLRDVVAAAQHVFVSDENYEHAGALAVERWRSAGGHAAALSPIDATGGANVRH